MKINASLLSRDRNWVVQQEGKRTFLRERKNKHLWVPSEDSLRYHRSLLAFSVLFTFRLLFALIHKWIPKEEGWTPLYADGGIMHFKARSIWMWDAYRILSLSTKANNLWWWPLELPEPLSKQPVVHGWKDGWMDPTKRRESNFVRKSRPQIFAAAKKEEETLLSPLHSSFFLHTNFDAN